MVSTIETIREKIKVEAIQDNLRKARRASIGAAVMLQEEMVDFVDRLAERGEAFETEGGKYLDKLFGQLLGKRKDTAKKAVTNLSEELDTRWTKVLNKLNLTTKSDIQALSKHLDKLAKKLDDLNKKKS